MIMIVCIYFLISAAAQSRGYKAPIFGGLGIALYIALEITIASILSHVDEYKVSNICAFISMATLVTIISMLPRHNPRSAPKKTMVPYGFLGVICLLLTFASAAFYALLMLAPVYTYPDTILFFSLLCLSGAITCFRLHRRTTTPDVSRILSQDRRPPVILLRSFAWDHARLGAGKHYMLPLFTTQGKSFEEFISAEFNHLGPFIAVGDPDDYLPSLGASKVYISDDEWRETVLSSSAPSPRRHTAPGDEPRVPLGS